MSKEKNYSTLEYRNNNKLIFICITAAVLLSIYVNVYLNIYIDNLKEGWPVQFKLLRNYSELENCSDMFVDRLEKKALNGKGPVDVTSDAYLGTQGVDKYVDKTTTNSAVSESMLYYRASDRIYLTDGIVTVYGNGVGEIVTVIAVLENGKPKAYDCNDYENMYNYAASEDIEGEINDRIQYAITRIYNPYQKDTIDGLKEVFTDECFTYMKKVVKNTSDESIWTIRKGFTRFGCSDKESGIVDREIIRITVESEGKKYDIVLLLELDNNFQIKKINLV